MAYLSGCCKEENLGFLPIAGAAATVTKVASSIPIIGGLFSNSKDPGRLAANAKYDQECRSGIQDACIALKHMSGRFGLTNEGIYCNQGGCGGWATAKAKDDAFSRWNSIEQSRTAVTVPAASPVDVLTAGVVPTPVGNMSPLVLIGIAGLTMLAFSKK